MDFIKQLKGNSILLVPYNIKDKILEYIDLNNILIPIKIITFNDLKNGLLYTYENQAIYEVMKKYNVNYGVAKNYISDTYYVDDSDNFKMNHLRDVKTFLNENNLLIYDKLFRNLLKTKDAFYVYGFDYINKFNSYLLDIVKEYTEVIIIPKEKFDYKHNVYEFKTMDDEVSYVAEEISKLIDNGVPLNKIFIANYSDEYYFTFKRIFNSYNIPYFIKNETSIYTTSVGKYLIDNLENDKNLLLYKLRKKFGNDNVVVSKISNLINKYYWCDNLVEAKDIFIEELKNTKIPTNHRKEEIQTINLIDNVFNDDEYVFLIGFNLGVVPKLKRDEDYISDDIKPSILENTSEYNNIRKQLYIDILKNIKNITITYKMASPFSSYYPSFLIDGDYLVKVKSKYTISEYSDELNKLNFARRIDSLIKFNENSEELSILNNNYDIDYSTYDNSFDGVDNVLLLNTIDDKLNFSYSNISTYNQCPFKFYLSNILKVNKFETTSEQFIGSLFHHVLEICLDHPEIDIDSVYNEYVEKEEGIVFNNRDRFFIDILRKEIHFVIDALRKQYEHSSHTETWHEKRVEIERNERIRTKVKGFVDKLLVLNNSVIIVDYKTNNTEVNPDLFEFGLSLQLPIYLYLLKELDSNIEVAGMYMQHILDLKSEFDPTKDAIEEKKKRLKLSGITINDIDLIKGFDDSYEKSEVIQGLRIVQKTGEFSKSKKIMDKDTRDELLVLVESIINNTIDSVCDGKFDISPIKIAKVADGCDFCEYKDICFRKYKDFNIKELPKKQKEEGDDE